MGCFQGMHILSLFFLFNPLLSPIPNKQHQLTSPSQSHNSTTSAKTTSSTSITSTISMPSTQAKWSTTSTDHGATSNTPSRFAFPGLTTRKSCKSRAAPTTFSPSPSQGWSTRGAPTTRKFWAAASCRATPTGGPRAASTSTQNSWIPTRTWTTTSRRGSSPSCRTSAT